MFKTVLAVLGALAVVFLLVVFGGGYLAYKKSSSTLTRLGSQQIEKFIETKHPPELVANSLHRIVNGAQLHPSWKSTYLLSVAMTSTQGDTMTNDKALMLEDAAQLAEKETVTKEEITAFMKKYQIQLGQMSQVKNQPVAAH